MAMALFPLAQKQLSSVVKLVIMCELMSKQDFDKIIC